ncbi:MAG: hypothetical protein IT436_04775 [Phycisphaerales bacterium]|nr:hypothetical protein [Phycisphaerales bacterium]
MRRGPAILLPLAMLVSVAAGQTPPAPTAIAPPTTRILDCTTSGCHAQQLNHKFLHGPTAIKACDACHEYSDPLKHAFTMKRQGAELCNFCHIDKTAAEGAVVHKPVAEGKCTTCHNPHGSESRLLLAKARPSEVCTDCHKEVMHGAHAHKPAADDCTQCHKAHTSDHEKLLTMDRQALCVSCHEDVGRTVSQSAHPHKPAVDDCLKCHTPHATDEIRGLRSAPEKLCISCHESIGVIAAGATHPHSAVTDTRACLNCHTAHGSDHEKQLPKDPVSTCLACHDKPIVVNKAHTVAALTELTDPSFHRHGPIDKGDCAACHEVHGGANAMHLVEPYKPGFYQAYSDSTHGLCFKCHDRELVTIPTTDQATRFRDGSRNLHAVHVKSRTQGLACHACHTMHASRFPNQIADSVAYGQWNLPINFKPTEEGGSCAPGCHKPAEYKRPAGVSPAAASPPQPPPAPQGPVFGPPIPE